jgi:hypothetical protein
MQKRVAASELATMTAITFVVLAVGIAIAFGLSPGELRPQHAA